MKRILLFSVLVVVGLVAEGFGPIGTGAAVNETVNETIDQLEDETNETANETDDPLAKMGDRAEKIDQTMILEDWTYANGQFTLEFSNTGLSRPVMIEPRQEMAEGTQRVTWHEEMVPRGGGTVTIPAELVSGEASLRISTAESRSEQRALVISTGTVDRNPLEYFGGTSGLFSGVFITVMLAVAGAGIVVWQEESGVVKA